MFTKLNFLLLSILTFNSALLYGQNLVPNSSFEELRGLPIKNLRINNFKHERKSGNKVFRHNLNYWYSANKASPDLRILTSQYYVNCKREEECGTAKTGENAIGIVTSMQNKNTKNYREYIEVKLKRKLKKDVKTYIEFWVRSDDESTQFSNNLGCYFSEKKIYSNNFDPLTLKPQVNQDSVISMSAYKWKKIEKEFTPSRPYSYLTIGNFFINKNTIIVEKDTSSQKEYIKEKAYYVIDDIRVWQHGDREKFFFKEKEITKGESIKFDNIAFDLNSFKLKKQSFKELDELVVFLKKSSNIRIGIYGYTDNSGDKNFNLSLSTNRAKTIYEYLKEKGISIKRMEFKGFGSSKPISDNSTNFGRKKNRRVEFIIMETK